MGVSSCGLFANSWHQYSDQDLSQVEVYLLSMGPAGDLFSSAGHAILRVKDPVAHTDDMVDWGAYSEEDPLLLLHFIRGTSEYHLKISPMSPTFEQNMALYPRDVFQERLVLTTQQKRKFFTIVDKWVNQPTYLYHVWKQNCCSIIAESLDTALDGALSVHLSPNKTDVTYRALWGQYFGDWAVLVLVADLLLNGEADRPLTEWDLRFSPMFLRPMLAKLSVLENTGSEISTPLLVEGVQLHRNPIALGGNGMRGYWILLGFFGLLFALSFGFQRMGRPRLARAGLLTLQNSWALFSVFVSIMVLVVSFVSYREYFHFSAVLWLFWPVDLLFMGCNPSPRKALFQHRLIGAHLGALVLLAILSGTRYIEQNISHLAFYLAPISLWSWMAVRAQANRA